MSTGRVQIAGVLGLLTGLCLLFGLFTTPADAAFGLNEFDVSVNESDGSTPMLAGTHPDEMTTNFRVNTRIDPIFGVIPDGELKQLQIEPILGLSGTPLAVPRCSEADFFSHREGDLQTEKFSDCPDATAVGVAAVTLNNGSSETTYDAPVFNLEPIPGEAARLGFTIVAVPVTLDIRVSEGRPYRLLASSTDISQARQLAGVRLTLWGNPSDPSHDPIRGNCIAVAGGGTIAPGTDVETRGNCPAGIPSRAFLTLPTACTGPLSTSYLAESWEGALDAGSVFTHDELTPPDPLGVSGCASLRFTPAITARPTTTTASSPTGIDVGLDVQDEGLLDPEGTAQSQIRRAEVTLPKGFTTNPSIAEGLTGCSEAQLEAETAGSPPGEGCPSASKIGTVQVQTPLLEQELSGSLYAATPYDNPFGTLLAVYMVIKNSALGIAIKQPLKVVPDPATGQLTALADELPQLPFSHFRVHFREGSRSPLASPPQCGSYDAVAKLTPWSGGPTLTTTSMFEITAGSGGGACPAGTPPLAPGFLAGTASNAAARYSEFDLRLTRGDPEQELRSFSVQMPPGLIGKVAGIPYCPDAAIEAARSKTGAQELSSPSCPAASRIGRLLVGAGVGPALSYVPGTLYLAGPFKGAQLSIVAITAAKVGPFDLGTVVIREGLKIDPDTAVVSLQPSASDPIPSIIKGIPVHARDIRVFVDRQEFVRNPTSCNPMAILSGVEGAGADPSIEADNQHATVSSRFQAADCASLAFGPQLSLGLKGGTKRTQLPRLRAVLTFPAGYNANIARAQVTLPHSVFLEQSHIRTICTRVQFAQGATPGEACPKGSIYGRARAITPLLSEPLEGPVFLRSSDHPLPDLVATLRNRQVAIDVVGRIDTDKKTARIRNTFEAVPDAPVSKFVLEMQGGKKGLLVNSTDLCRKKHRAKAVFTGHNGMGRTLRPVIKTSCKGKKK